MAVGSKTKNLQVLKDHGFHVPNWIAIDSDQCQHIKNSPTALETLCCSIHSQLSSTSYAVRSSSLTEDQARSSMAGQFHTELDIPPTDLATAIIYVLNHALWQNISLDKFSVIVQQYIPADYAWVCFTRNPTWEREIVIEYHQWAWEVLVSGQITPTKKQFYWSEKQTVLWHSLDIFKAIETLFWFPQDIERCIQWDQLVILQSRSITTLTDTDYQQSLYLDTKLPYDTVFHYEKTEICEVAPRPTPFTYSLLQRIYWEQGPIMQVYAKYSIQYTQQPFLKLMWSELYVSRDYEKKTLIHTFNPLKFRGFFKTLKNIYHTSTLFEDKTLVIRLTQALETPIKIEHTFAQAVDHFLVDYQIVFETNLFAAMYLKKFELLIKNEPIAITKLLLCTPANNEWASSNQNPISIDTSSFIWNTLEISDNEAFYSSSTHSTTLSADSLSRWNSLPSWKSESYEKIWNQAVHYQKYREVARTLMVKNLNHLRSVLQKEFKNTTHSDLYFHTLSELLEKQLDSIVSEIRKKEYEEFSDFNLPPVLRDTYKENITIHQWLSPGIATWILVTSETHSANATPQILYTQILSPTLTKYFDTIQWIVTSRGGLLSHLAIIAREQWIPIIVSDESFSDNLWHTITINGNTWEYNIEL